MRIAVLSSFLAISVAGVMLKRHFLRFSQLREKAEAAVTPCTVKDMETDALGRDWTRYCYHFSPGIEEPVEFLRDYTSAGWTYLISGHLGDPRFDHRILQNFDICPGSDLDGLGLEWKRFCYADGRQVQFERTRNEPWTYVVDKVGGCFVCEGRRVTHFEKGLRFQWQPYEPDEDDLLPEIEAELSSFHHDYNSASSFQELPCVSLEGDKSGRFFWPDFTSSGAKIVYAKDINGNYVWDEERQRRILGYPEEENPAFSKRGSEPPCPIETDSGEQIPIEPDRLHPSIFWTLTPGVNFRLSKSSADKAQGMYFISPETGLRETLLPVS